MSAKRNVQKSELEQICLKLATDPENSCFPTIYSKCLKQLSAKYLEAELTITSSRTIVLTEIWLRFGKAEWCTRFADEIRKERGPEKEPEKDTEASTLDAVFKPMLATPWPKRGYPGWVENPDEIDLEKYQEKIETLQEFMTGIDRKTKKEIPHKNPTHMPSKRYYELSPNQKSTVRRIQAIFKIWSENEEKDQKAKSSQSLRVVQ